MTAPTVKNMPALALGKVRGLITFDELNEFVARASRQGSTLKDVIIQLYDSPDELTNNAKTGGMDIATECFAAFNTSVQPDIMRDILTKNDASSGFLNRFTFVTGKYRDKPQFIPRPNMDTPVELLKEINDWAFTNQGSLIESREANDTWFNWFKKDWEPKVKAKQVGDMLARIDLTMKKLALLFAINDKSNVITSEHMEWAMKLRPYLLATYAYVDRKVTQSVVSEMEQDILDFIKREQAKGTKWVTPSRIKNRKKKYDSDQIIRCLETLEKLGVLQSMKNPPSNGRPIKGIAYIPAESA